MMGRRRNPALAYIVFQQAAVMFAAVKKSGIFSHLML